MALVDPTCFPGLDPARQAQQVYEAIYQWVGGDSLLNPICFAGLAVEVQDAALLTALRVQNSNGNPVCLGGLSATQRRQQIYEELYVIAADESLLDPDCFLGLTLLQQQQAIYAVFRTLAGDDSLLDPTCFYGATPWQQAQAIFEAVKLVAGGGPTPPPFNPTDIPGLYRNYDASALEGTDNSVITEWVDEFAEDTATAMGNPRLRLQSRRNRNVVEFDGSSHLNITTPLVGDEITLFAVVQQTNTELRTFLGTDVTNWSGANNSITPQVIYTQVGGGLDTYDGRLDGGYYIFIWVRSGATRSLFLNGIEIARSGSGVNTDDFHFDQIGGFSPYEWVGHIAQIGCYNRAILSEEVTQLNDGLFQKWGVTASIIADGNSLTFGLNVPEEDNYPSILQENLGSNYSVINLGVSDRTTAEQLADMPARVTGKKEAASNFVYICWEVTNSLYYGASVASVIADLKSIGQTQKAAGFYVVMCTGIPRNDGTEPLDFIAKMELVNDEIRDPSNIGVSWDVAVDLWADSRLQDPMNETYFQADRVHLTAAGYVAVESLIRPAVLSVL